MKKVKEELFLSLIFVAKWLALGLGSVGILYFAISLAYNKSYFDPHIAKFDFEISEQQELINGLKETIATLNTGLNSNRQKTEEYKKDLSAAEKRVEIAKDTINKLGLKWWEKIPFPMLKKDSNIEDAYQELEAAENNKQSIIDKINKYNDDYDESEKLIAKLSDKIQDHEAELFQTEHDKKEAQVGIKGPLLWLAGILGLT